VKRLDIRLYNVIFEGTILTPFGTADFAMGASTQVWESQGLSLVPAYLFLGGKRVDASQEPTLSRMLSPVIDLNRDFKLKGALTIHQLSLGNGELHLSGTATIPVSD
jgi:hypothetical protein